MNLIDFMIQSVRDIVKTGEEKHKILTNKNCDQ